MGQGDSFHATDVGVYFGEKGDSIDPYFNGKGPKRNACTECAGCMVGCRYNAKNTLDKNYLWFAEQNGAQVVPETRVTKIEELQDGTYLIHTEKSTSWFLKSKKVYHTKGIVLSAGVLGTLSLLFKNRDEYKTLTRVSPTLGTNVRTNSETITAAANGSQVLNHGIAISSVFQADEHTHIEICKFSDNSGAMSLMALPATDETAGKSRAFTFLINLVRNPKTTFKWLINPNFAKSGLFILVMQNLESSMKMIWKRGLFGSKLKFDNKSNHKIPAYIPIGQEVTRRYAEKINGIALNSTMEVFLNMSTTAHILSGCPMGEDASKGVVSDKFELNGYKNFYVLDGSIIPCNLGVNPSLTITTLSEYAMSQIPPKKGNPEHIGYEQVLATA
jgi:cholesterol oxidase